MGCIHGRSNYIESKKIFCDKHKYQDKNNMSKLISNKTSEQAQTENNSLKINKKQFINEFHCDPYLKYKKVKALGEGSYGKVFEVVENDTKYSRAIKEIKKINKKPYEYEKIIKEIYILKNLDHPNIVKIYEFYDWNNYYYIVTELCKGGELLDKIIKLKHFNEKIAAFIMNQLLSAVRYCHDNNIIHRDLKPENILLDSENNNYIIKVIDFGTGDIFKQNKFLNKQIGTPYYIAPEVLNNEYNEKCDMWSCGVILYIMLSGSPPFYGRTDKEIYAAVQKGTFSFKKKIWKQISNKAKNLIEALLNMDIKKRLSAEDAMKHKWFNILREEEEIENSKQPIKSFHNFNSSGEFLKKTLENLQKFGTLRKIQQATLYLMVHNLSNSQYLHDLHNLFKNIDANNDGKLAKEELEKIFFLCDKTKISPKQIDTIMNTVDIDKSGYIEYQEFLSATIDLNMILTEANLSSAFKMFDRDLSGKISSEELKSTLLAGNEKCNIKIWKKIISEFDLDNDEELSYEEFKRMMYGLITSV